MKTALLSSLLLMSALATEAQTTNLDFESWPTSVHPAPEGWQTNNLHIPVTSVLVLQTVGSSSTGIRLLAENSSSTTPGYIMNVKRVYSLTTGKGGEELPSGLGIPTELKGMYRHDIAPGDSAKLYVILKKNGTVLTRDSFFIKGTQATFTPFSYTLSSMSVAPDSIIFAAYAGSTAWTGTSRIGYYLELDELKLSNTSATVAVPHGDFDSWPTTTEEQPGTWMPMGDVTKTTDKHSGNYAVKLTTTVSDGEMDRAMLVSMDIPLSGNTDTLEGYYKFTAANSLDQGQIFCAMWDGDMSTPPQTVGFRFDTASAYTRFAIPLVNTIGATSLFLTIYSSAHTLPAVGSALYLDKLVVKKQNTGVDPVDSRNRIIVYPNPAKDVIQLSLANTEEGRMTITNVSGAVVLKTTINSGQQQLTIPLQGWQPGLYFCEIKQGAYVSKIKLVKE